MVPLLGFADTGLNWALKRVQQKSGCLCSFPELCRVTQPLALTHNHITDPFHKQACSTFNIFPLLKAVTVPAPHFSSGQEPERFQPGFIHNPCIRATCAQRESFSFNGPFPSLVLTPLIYLWTLISPFHLSFARLGKPGYFHFLSNDGSSLCL